MKKLEANGSDSRLCLMMDFGISGAELSGSSLSVSLLLLPSSSNLITAVTYIE